MMTNRRKTPEQLADELDAMLHTGDRRHLARGRPARSDDPLVKLAQSIAEKPAPKLSAAAASRIEAKMLTALKQSQPPTTSQPQTAPQPVAPVKHTFAQRHNGNHKIIRHIGRALTFAASIVIMMAFTVTMAHDSLPGEPLYTVKRAVERVERGGAIWTGNMVGVRLNHAETRAREAVTLINRDQFRAAILRDAIDDLTAVAILITADAPRDSIVIGNTMLTITAPPDVILRTTQVNALLDYVVVEAQERALAEPEQIREVARTLSNARESGSIFVPPPDSVVGGVDPADDVVEEAPTSPPPVEVTDVLSPTDAPTTAPTDAPSATPAGLLAFVDATGVTNVRSGPGTQHDIIVRLPPRTAITVIGENADGSWYQIRLEDGTTGWIATFLVTSGTPPPPGQGQPPDSPPGQGQPPDSPPGQAQPPQPPGQSGPPPGQGDPPSSPPGQSTPPGQSAPPPGQQSD
ncbi:MAG: SH3 domain-containing protein [Anaerolineaceae bacterium]|nr:MAG: SH3 domain-containing protein [Anaerolineaceae bacterium]